MRRREFIALLGGAGAWPLAARAQQPGSTRRVGILMPLTADDPYDQTRLAAFLQGLLTIGTNSAVALQQASRTVPVVFTAVTDPAGGGLVESLARPGGNMTGFALVAFGTSAKWLELLKEIAPGVKRVAVLRDTSPAGIGRFAAIQTVAPSLGIDTSPIGEQHANEIERAITAFARPNGGLIALPRRERSAN